MNSLANLNAAADVQGDSTSWPSDQAWDPSVATICTGNSPAGSRLEFHHAGAQAGPRQWDWSEYSHMLLASEYSHENLDSKPSTLQVEAVLGGGPAGAGESGGPLREYTAGIQCAESMSPSIGGGAAAQNSWPGLLNAVPLRAQQWGVERSAGSSYSPQSFLYGRERLGSGGVPGSGTGLSSYYTQQSPLQLGFATEQRRLHGVLERGTYSACSDSGSPDFTSIRLGLNLGGRTYFSANDSTILARFHAAGKRFRPNSPSLHVPLCQVEGCTSDLSMAKHYHRRHKVCEYHSKASTVIITGNTQRFCQQCSRFHRLMEFDEGKRSCRKRLADHNRRRRKPQPSPSATPCSNPGTSELHPTLDTDEPDSEKSKEHDTKAGVAGAHRTTRSHSEQQEEEAGVSKVEAMAASTSSTELAKTPSVSLTLQNAGSRSEAMAQHSNPCSSDEANTTHEASGGAYAPFLLHGPSLSLSCTVISPAAAGAAPGISMASSDSAPPSQYHPPPLHSPHTFNKVEMPVPWLKPNHAGPSSRINLMQKTLAHLAKASTRPPAPEDGPLGYSSRRDMENAQFLNEHGRIFANHLQATADDHQHYHSHHQGLKAENWMLETAVAEQDEGQIVLSLLETAGSKKEQNYSDHQGAFMDAPGQASGHGDDQRHPFRFLQQQQQHHHPGAAGEVLNLSSASRSEDMGHEASDAALSLQCMQDLRTFNESLYTTADFMKDGFV